MIIFLVNLLFWGLTSLLNLATWLIFTAAARLLVVAIQGFKLPGQAVQGGLEQLGNGIRACVEFLLNLVMEAAGEFVSSIFDAIKEGVMNSASATGSVLGGLMEELRSSMDGLIKDLGPQIIEGFTELITNVVVDLWNNYKSALAYVLENM